MVRLVPCHFKVTIPYIREKHLTVNFRLLYQLPPRLLPTRLPCTMAVKLGPQSWALELPFPIDQFHSTARISRKQAWVEFVVLVSSATQAYGDALCPFPLVL